MTVLDAKVIVVGGGPAGLAAAALLAAEGVDTILLTAESNGTVDPRTVALLQPALRLLARIGVWPGTLAEQSAALRHLDIIDEMGNLVSAPRLTFSAVELGIDSFGWNIPLSQLLPRLSEVAVRLGVRLMTGVAMAATDNGDHAAVTLQDGRRLSAQVLVAADGADSLLRRAAGIATDDWVHDQEALVTNFYHSGEHGDCSTERHRVGGPFTTVPLPGKRSSLVWMASPNVVQGLLQQPTKLPMEIQLATHGTLGLIGEVAAPRSFAMRGLMARQFAARRTLLIGEAAHAFPPIGAQGLNMSLRDAGHAVDVIIGHDDPGAPEAMGDYHGLRSMDVKERQAAVSLLNKSLLADFLPLNLMRVGALSLIAAVPPLRQLVMRQGLAPQSRLPFAMRG